MKKNYQGLIMGLSFIAVGILVFLKVTDVIKFNIWDFVFPTILVIIGINALANSRKNVFGYILIVLGLVVFAQRIIGFEFDWIYIVPIILILVGVSFIANMFIGDAGVRPSGNAFILFSGREDKSFEQDFKGSNITCLFGGYELDLREHEFNCDMSFNIITLFGGCDITLPQNVNVIVRPTAIFGGIDDATVNGSDNEFTIRINAVCAFGGIDIKNSKKSK